MGKIILLNNEYENIVREKERMSSSARREIGEQWSVGPEAIPRHEEARMWSG